MQFKDYYSIMGVDKTATQDQIKRAYRKLARKYHPDVSKEPDAEARIKEVNEAYEVLKDPEKRAAYDRLGSGWHAGEEFTPPPNWDAGFEFRGGGFTGADASHFSDFFESLFGGGGPFGHGAHPRAGAAREGATWRMRGEDHHAKILVSLEDAYHGAVRDIQLQMPEVDASGRITSHTRTLRVRIPKGVTSGQQIRLSGQGGPGMGGAPNGDLFLEIELQPHPRYRVEGRDVTSDLPLAPWEAALGATVSVPTLGGTVDMKIPVGSQSGRKLRLKGRGLPGNPAGDQYLVLQIMTPKADTEAARELYRRMERELPFNPREERGTS